MFTTTFAQEEEEPLLTIGCLTDFHIEGQFLNYMNPGHPEGVYLRQTTVKAIEGMKQENVDMMLLGGDYTSLTTIGQDHWQQAQKLLIDTLRSVFGDKEYKPVVYVTGNHEYQAPGDTGNKWYKTDTGSEKPWNSGDYYNPVMKQDIGELAEEDCFYEKTTNGKMNLLAAFHYNILGVDVVAMNTASCFFDNSSAYAYTMKSAKWCVEKIDALYDEDPDRTVFFLIHVPFNDSNSLSSGKGMKGESGVPEYLLAGLAKHPNLIMLYGHDHGGDNAMTQKKTSQRVTRYDINGTKMATNDSTHVDGTKIGDFYGASTEPFSPFFALQNYGNGKYIGKDEDDRGSDANNLNMMTVPAKIEITENGVTIPYGGSTYYIQSNKSGNFSAKTSVTKSYIYEVSEEDLDESAFFAYRTDEMVKDHYYIITQNGYALGNSKNTDSDYRRVLGSKPSKIKTVEYKDGADSLLMRASDNKAFIYKYVEVTEEPGGGLASGIESFFSIFMGSLRYHTDSFNPNGDYEDSADKEPIVIQGLVIKLFEDRVEFRIKNYGYTGTRSGKTIVKEPTPYTVFQPIKLVKSDTPTIVTLPKSNAVVGKTYNLLGQEVGPGYKGLVIRDGHKMLLR